MNDSLLNVMAQLTALIGRNLTADEYTMLLPLHAQGMSLVEIEKGLGLDNPLVISTRPPMKEAEVCANVASAFLTILNHMRMNNKSIVGKAVKYMRLNTALDAGEIGYARDFMENIRV